LVGRIGGWKQRPQEGARKNPYQVAEKKERGDQSKFPLPTPQSSFLDNGRPRLQHPKTEKRIASTAWTPASGDADAEIPSRWEEKV